MKRFARLFVVAAAFGMLPAAALAQPPVTGPTVVPVPAPTSSAAKPAPAVAGPAAAVSAPLPGAAVPVPGIGQPDGRAALPDQFTPIGREAVWFHNKILTPLAIAISVFVLLLLLYVVVRFRRSANPVPSRTTHHTWLEVIWTLVPVGILVAVAIPSIALLAEQYSPPKADLTVKVTGNQWYWSYAYPDNGGFEITSNILSDADDKKRGEPRLLGVDERMVVPAGATVKLIVTASDVIHSWSVPSFWVKMDAVPGRLNETWFKVDRPGLYYGQCSELCGARHGFMPIAVEVVTPARFAAWIASKGGTMPGQAKPVSSDATTAPLAPPAPAITAPGGATSATPAPNVSAGSARPAATGQSQASSSRGN
jgi:cytochrome c oxidase subunit 2